MLATLPDDVVDVRAHGRDPSDDDWLEWNLGRHRAQPELENNTRRDA